MKLFAAIAISCLLIIPGCSNPEAWGDALTETAPPNPNRAHAQDANRAKAETNTTTAEQPRRIETPVESVVPEQQEPGAQQTLVNATLAGYPSCHTGAVRFYVNRRYRGQFDEEGSISLEVAPGDLTLEVWDSGGHWIKEVNVQPGEALNVSFSCAEKEQISDDGGSGSSGSGSF